MATAFERLEDLLAALREERVAYVVIGGQAVNLQGLPRYTEDVDIMVDPDDDNVQRLRAALARVWEDAAIEEILAEDLQGDYAVVRYGTPDGFYIDIVSRIGDVFRFAQVEHEELQVGSTVARVATPRMLYKMKKDTVRPIDQADAQDLNAKFGLEED